MRGRDEKKPLRLVFGVHIPCPSCKGKGHKRGTKEICGWCDGLGVIEKGSKDEGK